VRCEWLNTHLHPYLDGELDAAGSATFERHLSSCPDCSAALNAEEQLRQTVSNAQLYERPSESLRKKTLAALPATSSSGSQSFPSLWRWVALTAALLLAAFVGREVLRMLQSNSQGSTIAATAVDAPLRSLQPGHLYDVPSSDQHTVKPWFDGKIDFAPNVRDFTDAGFPLLGGRLDVIDGQSTAALVYGRRKHIINVFVIESQRVPALTGSGDQHGYHWLTWQSNGLTYIAVSDVSSSDLDQLRDLFLN
jgi:anti-sigma factor (TIGR02949 family)